MQSQQEKLWVYDAVVPGQTAPPTVVEITTENISRYASLAQNPDPRYRDPKVNQEFSGAMVAMPTMVLSYAPLMRGEIAENSGFVALERSTTARRQTPFAKCEIRWFQPVQAGDTITGTQAVLEKYERRGSKFVTFRVQAANQHGQPVAEFDYTCIFEYAQGQRAVPQDRGTAEPSLPSQSKTTDIPAARSLAKFDSISVGDSMAKLTVSESQEIMNRKNDFRLVQTTGSGSNIHTDEEYARQNIFGGTVNSGPATMSYVDQMLELSFPLRAFYSGGRLLMRAIEPFRTGDTVTFQGEITAKRPHPVSPLSKGGLKGGIVECRVKGLNQRGDLVSLSDAALVLPD
ncbi:MAG: hypothetical protein BZY88_06280 [SAR202 cluster bacterium Io17-Chloro-G9]|nr:MAG: hypothetical protein BZY88_06280 [SAR202 cluster bacterium Io17-Chloro-G9]